MKFNIEESFKKYLFCKNLIIISIFLVLLIITKLLDYNKWIIVAISVIFVILFIHMVLKLLLFNRWCRINFILYNNEKIVYNKSEFYTLGMQEIIIPTKNILSYSIRQNILAKKFDLYKIEVSCGSTKEKFYFSSSNVVNYENLLLDRINKNSELKIISTEVEGDEQ